MITRGYLTLRAALAFGLILLGAFLSHQITVLGQREVVRKAHIAEALDAAQLGVAQLTIDMDQFVSLPGGQRAESLRGDIRRSARTLAEAKSALVAARAAGALGPDTAALIDDPALDPFGTIEELLLLAGALHEPVGPAKIVAARQAEAGLAIARRLLPLVKRMKETERAALDAAADTLTHYGAGAFLLTAAMVLGTALLIHLPMSRRILDAQREAEERRAAAEAASDAKSQFLATMSHEIRTPMNGVLGMADLLRTTPLDAEQTRMVGVIQRSGAALMEIIDAVLDLSKIEAGRYALAAEPFDIAETCRDVTALFAGRATGKGLSLTFEQEPPDRPARVVGDAGAVRQILSNLVGNAVKFTLYGGVTVRLTDAPEADRRRRIVIAVTDTGVGIPPEAQSRIFEQFEQADSSTTRQFGGTGLGLAIVRRLVEAMGGGVALDSAPGRGSTFTVTLTLPEAPAPPATPRLVASRAEADGPLRVLVAEDNRVNQFVVAELLKREGCEVTLADDGARALAQFRASKPDVVFMDVSMPVMSGYEATAAIRAWEREAGHAPTPIFGISAHALATYRDEGFAAGMDGFITKPVTPEALRAALAEARAPRIERESA